MPVQLPRFCVVFQMLQFSLLQFTIKTLSIVGVVRLTVPLTVFYRLLQKGDFHFGQNRRLFTFCNQFI